MLENFVEQDDENLDMCYATTYNMFISLKKINICIDLCENIHKLLLLILTIDFF